MQASKLSAQSPACRRKASLRWTAPSWKRKRSICARAPHLVKQCTSDQAEDEWAHLRGGHKWWEFADLGEYPAVKWAGECRDGMH